MDLPSDLLKTFLAVVDEGSFTKACSVVHLTQSAVSMQMKRLESVVDKALFRRVGRSVVLTPEGETLIEYARRIVKLQDDAILALASPVVKGLVRFGFPDDYAVFLPSILASFAKTYPNVQVEMTCEPSSVLRVLLRRGEVDLVLTTDGGNKEFDETGEVVREENFVWVTSNQHLIHEEKPVPLALFRKGCWVTAFGLNQLEKQNIDYRVAYRSPGIAGMQAAISSGLAVGLLARINLPQGCRELTGEDGFPSAIKAPLAIHQAPPPHSSAAECLAKHVAATLGEKW